MPMVFVWSLLVVFGGTVSDPCLFLAMLASSAHFCRVQGTPCVTAVRLPQPKGMGYID